MTPPALDLDRLRPAGGKRSSKRDLIVNVFLRQEGHLSADDLVDHAFHIREARDALFAESAYDHRMAFYGEPSPRLTELVNKIGVSVTSFAEFQALEPAGVH